MADLAGISRKEAKKANFAIIYGSGIKNLATFLECSLARARVIQNSIFEAAPEIYTFIKAAEQKISSKGFVQNWLGRRYEIEDPRFHYRAPNRLIQGGAAEVIKVAMNKVDDFLLDKNSKLILTVHDELIFDMAEEERPLIPKLLELMETAYPYKRLPLTASAKTSSKNLYDMEKLENKKE
jgi:DNA polymerase-1